MRTDKLSSGFARQESTVERARFFDNSGRLGQCVFSRISLSILVRRIVQWIGIRIRICASIQQSLEQLAYPTVESNPVNAHLDESTDEKRTAI
jgi:hypothetical protein